jgi:hypothetical protein
MALVGVATLPLAYAFYRTIAGRTVALIATALLAFSGWHLFYSRVAIPPVTMIFCELVASLLLLAALRTRATWLFVAAGVALGAGIYSYNSYPYVAVGVAAFGVYWLATQRRQIDRRLMAQLALSAALALLVVVPMVRFAFTHDRYFDHARNTSIFKDYRYEHADFAGKVDVLLDSGRDFVRRSVFEAKFDDTDGVGVTPLLDPITAVLLGVGVLLALRRWRDPGLGLCLIMLVVLSLPGIFSVFRGVPRRAIGIVPFVTLLAALPLASLIDWTGERGRARYAAWGLAAACVAAVLAFTSYGYFHTFANDARVKDRTAWDLVQVTKYINSLPSGTFVYLESDEYPYSHETRRYLAPDYEGADLSDEFIEPSTARATPPATWVAYVFMGKYLDHLDAVQQRYPGGVAYQLVDDGATVFRAYHLPGTGEPPPPPNSRCEILRQYIDGAPPEQKPQFQQLFDRECGAQATPGP